MEAERSFKKKSKGFTKPEVVKKVKLESLPRLDPERAYQAHKTEIDRGAKCQECVLYGLKQGPVSSKIVTNARLTIICEAPGPMEIEKGEPLIGKTGESMNNSLLDGGVHRDDCTLSNVVGCRPPEDIKAFEYRIKLQNRLARDAWKAVAKKAKAGGLPIPPAPKPQLTPIECCAPRLEKDVQESQAPVVLSMGQSALQAVAQLWDVPFGAGRKVRSGQVRIANLKRQIGAPLTLPDGKVLIATYIPAFGFRKGSRHYAHVIRENIIRAAEISRRNGKTNWSEPDYILDPSIPQIEEVLGRISRDCVPTTIDIETDSGTRTDGKFDPRSCRLRCIGFAAVLDGKEVLICVPIRHMDGSDWWTDSSDKKRVLQACANVFANCLLIGHNLAFDTSVLLRFGLISDRTRRYIDTMLMARNTIDCDLPKDLGFVAMRYFEVPSWKSSTDDKYYERIEDSDLHLYNLRDCLTCLRLYPILMDQIYKYGTTGQLDADLTIAPFVRDMGELGLFVHEPRRGAMSVRMNYEALSRFKILGELVGDQKFNPNSAPQVQRHLFSKHKLRPIINTKNKDWEEGEDPSTNSNSLQMLLAKQPCGEEVKKFVNTLLEYRAYKKLQGTYIDNLQVNYPDWRKWNIDMPKVPAVQGRKYRKLLKRDKIALGIEDDGIWEDTTVIPERPRLSRLPTTYAQHTVSSGRLAARPAIMNWPTSGKANMRKMICAPPGHVLVGADYAQLELRLYAAIAGDRLLLQAFKEGYDVHSWNAASLHAKKESEIPQHYEEIMGWKKTNKKRYKDTRNVAKIFAFLETYGGEADKLYMYMSMARDKATSELMFPDVTEAEVNKWHDMWHRNHPETKKWQDVCLRQAKMEGWTATPILSCRKRFFPGGLNKNGASFNHIIQGTGAELANKALEEIAKKIPYGSLSPFTGLCLQVHDYICVTVPKQHAKMAKRVIEEAMTTQVFGVHVPAEAKVSMTWANQ